MKFKYLKLAKLIKNKRIEKGISVTKLSKKIGVTYKEMSRFENGYNPDFYFVPFINICKELDINLFDLLQEVELYNVENDKLFCIILNNMNNKKFKIHAKNKIEAIKLLLDFLIENNLFQLDNKITKVDINISECEENINFKEEKIIQLNIN